MGSGVAVFDYDYDYDYDSRLDIFLAPHRRSHA
jgi:hypothetical protein